MIADALQHAHDRGVFHRDVKPSNVLMDADGRARLLDFGLAAVEDAQELTRSTSVLGSLPYMPPERLSGTSSAFGPRQEVYSLGVVLYELLTLRSPFLEDGAERTKERVLASAPTPPRRVRRGVPRDLEIVCLEAMDRDPDRRYATIAELAADLANVRAHRPIVARPAGLALRTRRLVQRHPTAAVAGVLGVVLFVGVPIAFGFQQRARADTEAALRATAEGTAARLAKRTRDFELVKHVVSLRHAVAREADLYPPWPERTAAMRAWLDEEWRPLLAARPGVEAALDELRSRARPATAEADGPITLDDRADQFLFETLSELVDDLDAFEQHEVASVAARLAWSERVTGLTLAHPNARASWDDVRDDLGIPPQTGLVPIGKNPVTGLWEFYHLRSAVDPLAIPAHDPTSGRVPVDAGTGIVFVYVPGGTFVMGAQRDDPGGPNFDPAAGPAEGPPREVTLAPFFLARHELTQGQWMRLGDGDNPSIYRPGRKLTWDHELTLAHPVENVDWNACDELCRENGLTLPTEAQWECACRAGTDTPWWTGAERDSLIGAINVADRAAKRLGSPWAAIADWPELDDGYPVHAPVDALRANPWGFHNVHGNVWEWTLDRAAHYSVPLESGTGRLLAPASVRGRVQRGGSCSDRARDARSGMRNPVPAGVHNGYIGLRPARAVR